MNKKFSGIFILTAILFIVGSSYVIAQKESLYDSVFRLHVIANSDDPVDQALKLQVKNEIVSYMKTEFENVEDVEHANKLAQTKTAEIEKIARHVIADKGFDYPVKVMIGDYEFPTKSYGNIILPQGNYQALRVVIGEGKGQNWWCVLFPPLCMVSSSDKGLSLDTPEEAQVSIKCLELLPKGMRLTLTEQGLISK